VASREAASRRSRAVSLSRLTLPMSGIRHGRTGGRACSPRPLPNRRQRVEVRDQDPFSVAA
jgi:hypothetical protein